MDARFSTASVARVDYDASADRMVGRECRMSPHSHLQILVNRADGGGLEYRSLADWRQERLLRYYDHEMVLGLASTLPLVNAKCRA